jgi:hypothetical protein
MKIIFPGEQEEMYRQYRGKSERFAYLEANESYCTYNSLQMYMDLSQWKRYPDLE